MRITLLAVAVAGIAVSMPASSPASEPGVQLSQYQSLGRQGQEAPQPPQETAPAEPESPQPPQETAPAEPESPAEPETPAPPAGAAAKPIPPSRKDVAPRSQTPQCAWIGKRMVRVLLRDDLIAADGFLRFYNTFSCPVAHLGQAFGCTLGLADDAPVEAVEARVDVCWADPETVTAPATGMPTEAPPTGDQTPVPKPGPESGK